jgi:hypothetical protein
MMPNPAESPKNPRISRSKKARTALWEKLRESPSNADGSFEPLTQADLDSVIKLVPFRWRSMFEMMFDIAMEFETDGKPGRVYWATACVMIFDFQDFETSNDQRNPSNLGGFFNLMRESLQPELRDLAGGILGIYTASYRYLSALIMRKALRPPNTPRKAIPTAKIEQLQRRLSKTHVRRKEALVQELADEYKVSARTVYRRLAGLNRQS